MSGRVIVHYAANLRDLPYNPSVHMTRPFYTIVETLCIVVLSGDPHMGIAV